MITRYGYYIASQDLLVGDTLSFAAKAVYERLGLTLKFAQRFDSVSIWVRDDGSKVCRISLHDFFSKEPKVQVFDLKEEHVS